MLNLKKALKKWLGITQLEQKQKQMNFDIMTLIEIQLAYKEQYPLKDPMALPEVDVAEQ